ncbi:hypothetical protein C9374_001633 [Naegleria lovaniensis]|uniref:Uncharacterized protein n=1 Tax=Naegleria lovaniensis TaxID=51637 RepID=A0AA88GRY0_NAELO|nr:uncharacterized protein C9374_001633 [Naegleria lovaniensis]KAG2387301.1 hypothetical protein C9374_001633 [Naegleria lovaniensis]
MIKDGQERPSSRNTKTQPQQNPLRLLLTMSPYYKFLMTQIITSLIFMIYFALRMTQSWNHSSSENPDDDGAWRVESFLLKEYYSETITGFVVVLIPIYMFITLIGIFATRKTPLNSKMTPSDLLLQHIAKYFGTLVLGSCLLLAVVILFGFSPFIRINSSNSATFQSARSEIVTSTTTENADENWICTKLVPSSMINSHDIVVFAFMSKCYAFSIGEIVRCLLWCLISSLIIFVQPLCSLSQWTDIVDTVKLVALEKTTRLTNLKLDLQAVALLRKFVIVHIVCIWISGFVIPLDWEKDWQYFPICTTVGLIIGTLLNLILYVRSMKYVTIPDKED